MRRFISMCNSVLLFAAIFVHGALANPLPQTTFSQVPPNRTQGQNQQGLPPEKKKSLSNYGPEDAFPGEADQENRNRKGGRSSARPSPTVASSTTAQHEVAPSPAPSMTPVKGSAVGAKPSPNGTLTVAALSQQKSQQSLPGKEPSTDWVLAGLAIASLFVLTALIYVILKLTEKLREGSS